VKRLTVKYKDVSGDDVTLQYIIDNAYTQTSAELLAFIQDLQDASQCRIEEAFLSAEVDLATITGRTATDTGPYKTVDDKAIFVLTRSDDGGRMRVSVPAPEVLLFDQTGAYAFQAVDLSSALALALIATGQTEPLLGTPGDGAATFVKGWRLGQHHP